MTKSIKKILPTKAENNQKNSLEELIKSILNVHRLIWSVNIINNKGRLIESSSRTSVMNSFTSQKMEMFFMGHRLQESMRGEFNDEFGSVLYSFVQREKIGILSFKVADHVILVMFHPNVESSVLARNIFSIIDKQVKETCLFV
ncbi:MAG: hypothetical protein HY223_03170 [Thaumarchaeota archaeon]|nr:hypothetical protein [Nitrososphaerota archaeon]